jgi:uncharacterized protein (TIGR03067 family)
MTIKTALAIITLLVPGALICAQDASTSTKPTREQTGPLQGTWEGVEAGHENEGKCAVTITGNAMHFQGADTNEWYKTTFTLPAGTDPKQLRITITSCPQPDYVGKVSLAIFKIEEGTLTIVGHEPGDPESPKTFDGDKTSRTLILRKTQSQKKNPGASKSKE